MVKIVQRLRKRMARRSQKMKAQDQKRKMKILLKVMTMKLPDQWKNSRS
jgi:hypothetical protein